MRPDMFPPYPEGEDKPVHRRLPNNSSSSRLLRSIPLVTVGLTVAGISVALVYFFG